MDNTNSRQKIVVAVDGSKTAHNAAEVAIQIARAESQRIEGFYIFDEHQIHKPSAVYEKELGSDRGEASRTNQVGWFEESRSSVLDQLHEQCLAKGVPVITEALLGDVSGIVLEKAKQISFLALGRRGNSHTSDAGHLGDNFRHIAHHATVPLIVGGDIAAPIKRLFLVHDGSQKADLALKLTLQLKLSLSAIITIGLTEHTYLEADPDTPLFRLSNGGIDRKDIVDLRSKPVRNVVDAIAEKQSDLVVMSGYRHPEIMEWLVGSPNDQILRQSPLPAVIA